MTTDRVLLPGALIFLLFASCSSPTEPPTTVSLEPVSQSHIRTDSIIELQPGGSLLRFRGVIILSDFCFEAIPSLSMNSSRLDITVSERSVPDAACGFMPVSLEYEAEVQNLEPRTYRVVVTHRGVLGPDTVFSGEVAVQ